MNALESLIQSLKTLPGVGSRSAERFALHIATNVDSVLHPIRTGLEMVLESMVECEMCHNLCSCTPCQICADDSRDPRILCIVENIVDLWAMERSGSFKGMYHVIGGTISAIDGRLPDQLNIASILGRLAGSEEILIAIKATIDGQTTAHYITDLIAKKYPDIRVSRLASGIPIGAELNYMDDNTLSMAIQMRQEWK